MPRVTSALKTALPASVPDKVVDAVNEGILRRSLSVGQRLVEADLTQELGVSRGTVREALKKLSAAGVVRLLPHRGAFIRKLSRRDAEELLMVLEVLCGLAARLAAAAIDKGGNRKQFLRATESILAYEENVEYSGFLEERARFYQTMLEIGGNAELIRIMPVPNIHLFRTQFHGRFSGKDLRETFREYQDVCKAILDGDVERAETRMCRHIRRTAERMSRLPDDAFYREEDS